MTDTLSLDNSILQYAETGFTNQADYENYRHKHYEYSRNFDKTTLMSFDEIVESYELNYPDSKIDLYKIQEYADNGFLAEFSLNDDKKGYLVESPGRINFINKIVKKWEYNKKELSLITQAEDWIISEIMNSTPTDYPGCNSDKFVALHCMEMIEVLKLEKKLTNLTFSRKRAIANSIKKYKKTIQFLEKANFTDRPLKEQQKINNEAEKLSLWLEYIRMQTIFVYRAKLLLGFHPHIFFSEECVSTNTVNQDEMYEKYNYSYNEAGLWLYLGKISNQTESIKSFVPSEQLFYSTPEFYVGYTEDNKIEIKIRNPEVVTSNFMRDVVSKIYTKFRASLNIKRGKWGTKTGSKGKIKQRDAELKKMYSLQREMSPNLAADRTLEIVLKGISPKYGELSPERAKRIIYS